MLEMGAQMSDLFYNEKTNEWNVKNDKGKVYIISKKEAHLIFQDLNKWHDSWMYEIGMKPENVFPFSHLDKARKK